jgi:hypothetical protein
VNFYWACPQRSTYARCFACCEGVLLSAVRRAPSRMPSSRRAAAISHASDRLFHLSRALSRTAFHGKHVLARGPTISIILQNFRPYGTMTADPVSCFVLWKLSTGYVSHVLLQESEVNSYPDPKGYTNELTIVDSLFLG